MISVSSRSPLIENAGVARSGALKLFVEKGKIVLLSTHDPLLALSGDKRLVIRNGAVCDVISPSSEEIALNARLTHLDAVLSEIRVRLRAGQRISLGGSGLISMPPV